MNKGSVDTAKIPWRVFNTVYWFAVGYPIYSSPEFSNPHAALEGRLVTWWLYKITLRERP